MRLSQSILSTNDKKKEEIEITEWTKEKLFVCELTAGQRAEFETAYQSDSKDALKDMRVDFVIMCLTDESGKPVFTQEDKPLLLEKSAQILDRISSVAQRISGMAENDVEDEIKN